VIILTVIILTVIYISCQRMQYSVLYLGMAKEIYQY